ncbi:MAG: alanine:cation symporter family protein [Lachnospiraceae bacterium]|nr:alanine:cation symporter family protein [Lachnospiraceae bacterium]
MENVMNVIASVNDAINSVVWGIPMLILIIGTGIYMTIGMKFFQITRIKHWMNETFLAIFKKKHVTAHTGKDESSISQFQALSTALAATIGVGNIAGVAGAIITGGAGAVFWMWLSALFGMMTNYSENVLGIYYRRKNSRDEWSGGAMYYLQDGLKGKKVIGAIARPLAVLFALFCVFASFGIGNMTQVHEIASSLQDTFKIPPIATGIIISVVAALVILGGIKAIGSVTEKIVPFMACAYILGTIIVLIMNITSVPAVFGAIFTNAFGLRPIAGATVGIMIKQAMTMGFKRGVFSNEAGLGSSVMVHSASNVVEPITQGMWGIFEVFFDTIVVCTLTAFTVLSSGLIDLETGEVLTASTGASLVSEALSEGLGTLAGGFVAIAICLFAFSTVLGWSFYGTKSCEYLFGTKATIIYKVIFIVCIIFGATMSFDLAWAIADTLNALMAIPNLIGVLALSGTVFAITKNYLARRVTKTDVNAKPMLSYDPEIQKMQEKVLKQQEEA